MNALDVADLSKRFRNGVQALADLSLSVPAGGVYGLLGPNGAGKSTLLRIVTGMVHADSGSVSLFGQAASVESRRPLGALIESPSAYPFLTARAFLRVIACTAGVPADPGALLDRVGLTAAADRRIGAFSLGMKQRLGIANALLMPRDLLVLDEPSNGLDPQGTREVRSLIRSLADEGTTVFLSSHLLAEVEQVCTHVAVMSTGRLVAQGSLDELRAEGSVRIAVRTPDPAEARRVLATLGLAPDGDGDEVAAELPAGLEPEVVTEALVRAGVRVRGIAAAGASLEDRFVALTGEGFDVAQ